MVQILPIIQVQNLYKAVAGPQSQQNLTILNQINFTINNGETVAIVGPSGSGKSTLLGLLAGLDQPSGGSVVLDGASLYDKDEDSRAVLRAQKLGFVFQAFQLLPTLTALENVMLPLEILDQKNARSTALEVLERVGLQDRVSHYPNQLSGGEQQRVAIARAFAPRPKILLADEPTGNLDTHTGQRVIDLLFELNAEQGTTLVLVTHDHNLAQRCQRELRLEGGSLLQERT
ncbi:MAG: ABC transporter ATP-binding protein [Gammaproteobacteria bacterium]|nr:ABC transporter ATP-binding protein [Gammaproteobacteria bacterium]MDH5800738.1 ABC transporter ATP-binding protein [Gammaproteobacteria bacterium]